MPIRMHSGVVEEHGEGVEWNRRRGGGGNSFLSLYLLQLFSSRCFAGGWRMVMKVKIPPPALLCSSARSVPRGARCEFAVMQLQWMQLWL